VCIAAMQRPGVILNNQVIKPIFEKSRAGDVGDDLRPPQQVAR
jgi:hypothetical protein